MKRTLISLIAMLLLAGCANHPVSTSSPYSPAAGDRRDTRLADELMEQALEVAAKDPAKAERLLCDALAADLYHGPAHNNLGVLMLKTGRLFEAANEFEWARKLLPGHPDPRMNLALTLERAGRTEDALATYDSALEAYPGHVATIQALTRLQIRSGKMDDRTGDFLREISMRGDTEKWREWGRWQLAQISDE